MNFNHLNSNPIIQTQTHEYGVVISHSLHKVYFSDTVYFSLDKKEWKNEGEKDLMTRTMMNHTIRLGGCQT